MADHAHCRGACGRCCRRPTDEFAQARWEQRLANAQAGLAGVPLYSFQVFIDRQELGNLEPFDVVTPVFKISYPVDNLFELKAGSYNSVATGRFVMLRPLTPGRHTIVVRDQLDGETAQVTAFLTVR